MRLHVSRIRYPRVIYGMMWGMLDVTQAKLPVCPQQWDRESALHGEWRQDGRRSDQFFIRASRSKGHRRFILHRALSIFLYTVPPITKFVMSDKVTRISISNLLLYTLCRLLFGKLNSLNYKISKAAKLSKLQKQKFNIFRDFISFHLKLLIYYNIGKIKIGFCIPFIC